MDEILEVVSTREGHLLLESGYRTDFRLPLDTLFVDPPAIAPLVAW